MLTYRRGLDGFHGFSDNGQVLFLFFIFVGDSFWFRFSVGTTGAGGAGNCFSRFPRLGMPSGVTLVN